jgi:Cu/Ag efflux protein CusF
MHIRAIRPLLALVFAVAFASATFAQQAGKQQPKAEPKKEHVFKGKIESVDEKGKSVTVNGENVEGWMSAMTMSYAVDKADVLKKVKAGDQITAKVYDGDLTLHDVQVVPAKAAQPPAKAK